MENTRALTSIECERLMGQLKMPVKDIMSNYCLKSIEDMYGPGLWVLRKYSDLLQTRHDDDHHYHDQTSPIQHDCNGADDDDVGVPYIVESLSGGQNMQVSSVSCNKSYTSPVKSYKWHATRRTVREEPPLTPLKSKSTKRTASMPLRPIHHLRATQSMINSFPEDHNQTNETAIATDTPFKRPKQNDGMSGVHTATVGRVSSRVMATSKRKQSMYETAKKQNKLEYQSQQQLVHTPFFQSTNTAIIPPYDDVHENGDVSFTAKIKKPSASSKSSKINMENDDAKLSAIECQENCHPSFFEKLRGMQTKMRDLACLKLSPLSSSSSAATASPSSSSSPSLSASTTSSPLMRMSPFRLNEKDERMKAFTDSDKHTKPRAPSSIPSSSSPFLLPCSSSSFSFPWMTLPMLEPPPCSDDDEYGIIQEVLRPGWRRFWRTQSQSEAKTFNIWGRWITCGRLHRLKDNDNDVLYEIEK